jgi:type IV pilus assembly protein PilB
MAEMYKRPLGEILVLEGDITKEQLQEALAEQKKTLEKLGKVLVDMDLVSEERVTEARAEQLDVPYVNLQEHKFEPEILNLIPENLARRCRLIPVHKKGDRLVVAMADPMDVEATDLIQLETKLHLEPALATEWRIMEAIDRQYGADYGDDLHDSMHQSGSDLDPDAAAMLDTEDDEGDIDEVRKQIHKAPIVRTVNMLLTQAVRKKASDIHIEPRRNVVEVRFRMDGELHTIRHIPRHLHPAISSRIKIMADMDIAERRMPQDGRISVRIDGRGIDVRVSTAPTLYGERVVMRILDRQSNLIPLEKFGYTPSQLGILKGLVTRPQGIVLITGPTGSGKTTTLYAILNMLKSESTNIMTVEDPIEYELDGVSQTNVHQKIGLSFASQLRAILRQDPDTILVGEIRDTETADVAFRSALTGHLVLSTLHCNDAPSAINRLLDMGVEPFLVGSAINGIVAQRLVRLLCPDCKEAYEPDESVKALLGADPGARIQLYRAVGCGNCDSSGYKGRTGVSEIMTVNSEIRRLCVERAPADDIAIAAMRDNMTTMRQDATEKVLAGLTTLEEVQRKVFFDPADGVSAVHLAAA